MYSVHDNTALPVLGFPIQRSPDQRLLPPSRSLSQAAASFFGIFCRAIHQYALLLYNHCKSTSYRAEFHFELILINLFQLILDCERSALILRTRSRSLSFDEAQDLCRRVETKGTAHQRGPEWRKSHQAHCMLMKNSRTFCTPYSSLASSPSRQETPGGSWDKEAVSCICCGGILMAPEKPVKRCRIDFIPNSSTGTFFA